MKILFINPNSSVHMTDSIVDVAAALVPGAEVLGWTNADGPEAIQGPEDGAAAVPGLLALLADARAARVDAIVIACFDDTGLAQARAAAHCPVIGIGQAAYHMAALRGGRAAVVTTLPVSVPVIEENIRTLGFAQACPRVAASGLGVLEVEAGSARVLDRLVDVITAEAEAGAATVILGCAGMAAHRGTLQARVAPWLVDGVTAAAVLAQALAIEGRR